MRYVIGDIHGNFYTFCELLKTINFNKLDELYLTGDLVDRGPASFEVIKEILQLKDDGYNIQCVMGNHEELMLDSLNGIANGYLWFRNGGYDTLKSYGYTTALNNHIHFNEFIPKDHFNFISNLPYIIELEDYVICHGGLNFYKENPLLTDPADITWLRHITTDPNYKKSIGGRTLVSGHNISSKKEIIEYLNNNSTQLVIDNGCFYTEPEYGNLCCFNLDSKELVFQPNMDSSKSINKSIY